MLQSAFSGFYFYGQNQKLSLVHQTCKLLGRLPSEDVICAFNLYTNMCYALEKSSFYMIDRLWVNFCFRQNNPKFFRFSQIIYFNLFFVIGQGSPWIRPWTDIIVCDTLHLNAKPHHSRDREQHLTITALNVTGYKEHQDQDINGSTTFMVPESFISSLLILLSKKMFLFYLYLKQNCKYCCER